MRVSYLIMSSCFFRKKITKLKKKKKYYFKIRAYRITSGKKVIGAWSKIKSVKIKK